ncbi:DNA alkylation repair protein [Amycolatopsis suaedae]|uniref:DNA alkylation repair protein n=1 Tax=Amycolatopsis suaedae TaxID=2510978 RepID=A0A4Q7J7R9_9PSEU|nr:DNA alkylation repair protein [Amycolatopsis suaedae]RZQ62926.1 DNA alkylation repair protein [Amycolatopsis suaedae]
MNSLVHAARDGLAGLADPAKAPDMQRYMKSEMPFRGVPSPARKRLAGTLFAEHPLDTVDDLVATTRALWHDAGYREERYLAIDLTGYRAYRRWQDPGLLPLYRELVVTGAWWDYVDEVAIRRVGPILLGSPGDVTPLVRAWATDDDLWLRRTAVICQVGAGARVDTDLLTHAVEANLGDRNFFLRKGIGWALRQHARVDPGWVRRFVDDHPGLSPLSVREALKHLAGNARGR